MMNERKHLTSREVEHLMAAIKGSRNEARDRCLLLLMFRHGLRVSEACGLKLDQVDTESRVLHVARLGVTSISGFLRTPSTDKHLISLLSRAAQFLLRMSRRSDVSTA
jgi:integrase